MGRKRDRFWDHAEALNGRFKCIYCKREFPGGASRIKSHLAGAKGRDIVICEAVPEDVREIACEEIKKTYKKHRSVSTSSGAKESTITSSGALESTITSTSISKIIEDKIVTLVFI
jgi:disease resistance protein RPS2